MEAVRGFFLQAETCPTYQEGPFKECDPRWHGHQPPQDPNDLEPVLHGLTPISMDTCLPGILLTRSLPFRKCDPPHWCGHQPPWDPADQELVLSW